MNMISRKLSLIALCVLHFALVAPLAFAIDPTCTTGSCGAGKTCAIDTRLPGGSSCFPSCSLDSSGATPCNVGLRCISVTGQGVCVLPTSPFLTGVTPTTTPATPTAPEVPFTSITPVLGVEIPGLTLSPATKNGDSVSLPFLAQYINAAYKYMVTVVLIVAIVMVVYGGFRYLVGASMGDVKSGKKIIMDALGGMLIVLGAYMILNTVNPETLNLNVLELAFVKTTPMDEVLEEFGSAPDVPDDTIVADSAGAPGTWRARMMDACGRRDGLTSQTTYAGRIERLKTIVDTWKRIGLDEGGAIYVRGGKPSCAGSAQAQGDYLALMLASLDDQYLGGITGDCLTILKDIHALESRPARTAKSRELGNSSRGTACKPQWTIKYESLLTGLARDRGMYCGDCASTVKQMYSCFDSSPSFFNAKVVAPQPLSRSGCAVPADAVYVWSEKMVGGAPIAASALIGHVGQMKFGDIIAYCKPGGTGHVFMFTGGDGGLPYEIFEMGAGGGVAAAGGATKAKANSGSPFPVSGMKVHSSAAAFLTAIAESGARAPMMSAIYAWRPIQPE